MQWFHYQPELVGGHPSVAHCTADDPLDDQLESLCSQAFSRHQVVLTAEPGTQPSTAQPLPGAPCVPCLLQVITATQPEDVVAVDAAPEGQPVGTKLHTAPPAVVHDAGASTCDDRRIGRDKTALAVSLRKAQWLLDDAAHEIPGDRYSLSDATELAKTLEELAQFVRQQLTR